MRTVMLFWLLLSGLRSIFLNMTVTIIGLSLCSLIPEVNLSCIQFSAQQACELGCSIYMWTVVNDYYHSLRKRSARSHVQSYSVSPNASQLTDDTSSLLLSDEWSLPTSLFEEFHKSTEKNIDGANMKIASDSKNVISRSIDSLLAQAMVDWFIKKIFRKKPKLEDESKLNASNVAVLKDKIKKSIADIDQGNIKGFVVPEIEKSNNLIKDQVKINQPTNSVEKATPNSETPFNGFEFQIKNQSEIISKHKEQKEETPEAKSNENKNKAEYSKVKAVTGKHFTNIPVGITLRQNSNVKINNSVHFKNVYQTPFQNIEVNYLLSNQPRKNPFLADNFVEAAKYEPSKALDFVQQLFPDDIVDKIKENYKYKPSKTQIVFKKSVHMSHKNTEIDEENVDLYKDKSKISFNEIKVMAPKCGGAIDSKNLRSEQTNICFDDRAIGSSISIVQSVLDNIMDETNEKINVLEQNKTLHLSCSNDYVIKINPQSSKYKYNRPDRLKSVLKSVNENRISRLDKNWKMRKPYNKENEDVLDDKNKISVKALRYHYRRTNQNKIPIRKSTETGLNQKTLKSIINGMKLKENVSLKQYLNNQNYSNKLSISPDCILNQVNVEKGSQTTTTKQLLDKISKLDKK